MKNLICLILTLALLLAACGGCSNPAGSGDLSSGSSGASQEELPFLLPEEVVEKAFMDSFSNEISYSSFDIPLEAEIQNFSAGPGNNFSYDIVLTNEGGKPVARSVSGQYVCDGSGGFSESGDISVSTFSISCSPLDERRIAFFGLNQLFILDIDEMTFADLSGAIASESGDMWVESCCLSGENYVSLVQPLSFGEESYESDGGPAVIFTVSESAELISKQPIPTELCGGWCGFKTPSFRRKTAVLSHDGSDYLIDNSNFYRLSDGAGFRISEDAAYVQGDFSFVQAEISEINGSNSYNPIGNYALLYKYGLPVDFLPVEDPFEFGYHQYISGLISADGNSAELFIKSPIGVALKADFDSRTAETVYNVTENHLAALIAASPDGKHSLWYSDRFGGGDIICAYLILRNNETGEISLLDTAGGMYGGYGEAGFLKNNDIYSFSLSSLEILDPSGKNVIFDLSENFPLGLIDEENELERYLLTFRRSPEDFTYIAVYAEGPSSAFNYDDCSFGGVSYHAYGANYIIGFFDSEGRLLESYDTGCPVAGNMFGFQPVSMRYSGEALTLFVEAAKGSNGFTGVFDLETHEFRIVSQITS